MLAFDFGGTTWTLGLTTAATQRPRVRTVAAGDLEQLVTAQTGDGRALQAAFSLRIEREGGAPGLRRGVATTSP